MPLSLEIYIQLSSLKDVIITIQLVFHTRDKLIEKEECKSLSIEEKQIYK